MPKVTFTHLVRLRLKIYAQQYEEYFTEIYSDTGIWSESIILENYRKEAKNRRKEIAETIQTRLKLSSVLGNSGNNTVKIPWRTKMLYVTYEDVSEEERIILDLEILTQ